MEPSPSPEALRAIDMARQARMDNDAIYPLVSRLSEEMRAAFNSDDLIEVFRQTMIQPVLTQTVESIVASRPRRRATDPREKK